MLYVLLVTVLEMCSYVSLVYNISFWFMSDGIEYLFLFDNFTFWTLLLTIVFVQSKSFKFLFLRKYIIGDSGNTSFNWLFIYNMFQCFFTAFFTFDKVQIEVKVNGVLYLVLVGLPCSCRMLLIYCHIFQPFYIICRWVFPQNLTIGFKIAIFGAYSF